MNDYNGNDVKFALKMVEHHQMAVEMAAKLIDNGLDPALEKLSNDIIDAQTTEIKFLKKWLTDRGESASSKSGGGMKM